VFEELATFDEVDELAAVVVDCEDSAEVVDCDEVEEVDCDEVDELVVETTQLSASLDDDARTTSSRPSALMCSAFTSSPLDAPATGFCSLKINVTPSTLTWVLAAGWTSTLTGTPPTVIDAIVLVALSLEHELVDSDWTAPTWIAGSPRTPMDASSTEAVAVDVAAGFPVVTFAQSVSLVMSPEIETTHGGAVVLAADVATDPVSGVLETETRPEDEMA
jgi:hypothetical protein